MPEPKRLTINGQPATNRAGAAALLGISVPMAYHYASVHTTAPWPDPVEVEPTSVAHRLDGSTTTAGRDAFYLESEIEQFRAFLDQIATAKRPRSDGTRIRGKPDDLIDDATAAKLQGIDLATHRSYVWKSVPRWELGKPGLLPIPHRRERTGGTTRPRYANFWTKRDFQQYLDTRPGRGALAGRPKGVRQPLTITMKPEAPTAGTVRLDPAPARDDTTVWSVTPDQDAAAFYGASGCDESIVGFLRYEANRWTITADRPNAGLPSWTLPPAANRRRAAQSLLRWWAFVQLQVAAGADPNALSPEALTRDERRAVFGS